MTRLRRHRVTFQSPPTAVDAAGQKTGTWTDVITVSAQIRGPGGSAGKRGDQTEELVNSIVRIRYPRTEWFPDPEMRISHDTRTLNIVAVSDPDGRKRYLEITAKEVGT